MVEGMVVIGIVGSALALVTRSLYRALTGKGEGCGCGGACPRSVACSVSAGTAGSAGTLLQVTADTGDAGGGA